MVLAALPVLVVVFAVAVIPMTARSTTGIRRVLVGDSRAATMSECRTAMSECRTAMSELRTTRATSSLGAAIWAHRSALTASPITSLESTASHDRDTCPAARDTRTAARARSPCGALSEPGNQVHREPATTVAPEPEASY